MKCKGSVHLKVATAKDHKKDSPVRLIMLTQGGRQNVARIVSSQQAQGGGVQSAFSVNSPRAMSDIAFDNPDGECKGVLGKGTSSSRTQLP